jgi:autotransporter-associated beta strand protein
MFWGSTVPHEKQFALNGGARIFKDNGTATLNGTMSLTGSNALEAASNSGTDLTVGAPISGTGRLNKLGAGNVILLGDSSYSGGTVVTAGNLLLGNGGTTGSVQGDIDVTGGLFYHRSDEITLRNNLTGVGSVYLRTAAGLVLDGSATVNLNGATGGGNLEVGRDVFGKLIIRAGARPVIGRLSLGNVANTPGEVIQEGGDVIVSLETRIGHWPNNTSSYLLGGGTLSLTNVPTGTATERNGILYIGVDGTGIFTQTGGVATAHGIVLDNRGGTVGDDTLNLNGGVFNIGASGLTAGGNGTNSYLVNLGGGRIVATAGWTSGLNMKLTATTGDFTFETRGFTNTLAGALSSFGGLIKQGPGVLVLSGTNTYEGMTAVNEGTLVVLGPLGVGFGEVQVAPGATLAGTNTITDSIVVKENGIIAPGNVAGSIATLTTLGTVDLGGDTRMEIAKSGAVLSNDKLSGSQQLNLGGRLLVTASGAALAAGDSFRLFDATAISGSFSSVSLPTLAAGLSWDTSKLASEGIISVTAPPPTLLNPTVSGNNLRLAATGGVPGAPYRVVASVDLSAPLASWVEVANGTFDASGNLEVIITIDPAEPQKYYSIRTP